MTRILLASTASLAILTCGAMAQSTTTQESTSTTSSYSRPVNVSSSGKNVNAVQSDGDQTAARGTSATESNGDKTYTTVTNKSYPLTGMITTTRKTTHVVNGTATVTTTTTNTYPPANHMAPQVTTTTRSYAVGTK